MTPPTCTLRIAVAGGGTGGHTYPALTTIDVLRDRLAAENTTLDVTCYGTAASLESRIAAEHGIPFTSLATGKIRRSLRPTAVARTIIDLARVAVGVIQAVTALARTRPDVVFTTGGYVAVPIGLAARLTGHRLVIHEQITTLGLANRLLAQFASAIALSHPTSRASVPRRTLARVSVTGNPIRHQLLHGNAENARMSYRLDPALPLLYVTGGATGAQQINHLITNALPELLRHCQILHQCGTQPYQNLQANAARLPADLAHRYLLVPYLGDDLGDVLAAADLVISRAGAGTLAELTAIGKPSILIPLVPTAADEQQRNAELLATAGAATALTGRDATPAALQTALIGLLDDPGARQRMAKAAAALGRPDAAQHLVDLLIAQARR